LFDFNRTTTYTLNMWMRQNINPGLIKVINNVLVQTKSHQQCVIYQLAFFYLHYAPHILSWHFKIYWLIFALNLFCICSGVQYRMVGSHYKFFFLMMMYWWTKNNLEREWERDYGVFLLFIIVYLLLTRC
jgi:hypothetical protein